MILRERSQEETMAEEKKEKRKRRTKAEMAAARAAEEAEKKEAETEVAPSPPEEPEDTEEPEEPEDTKEPEEEEEEEEDEEEPNVAIEPEPPGDARDEAMMFEEGTKVTPAMILAKARERDEQLGKQRTRRQAAHVNPGARVERRGRRTIRYN
jgi:hypothetical protein